MSSLRIQPRYTRSDPKGHFPRLVGVPEPEHNRLAVFWRPMIDMTDSELASMILRFIRPVAAWIADPGGERWSWFAMLGVPGQRHQVIRHAGLDRYDSREPGDLAEELRTPAWRRLVDLTGRFDDLDARMRTLVVFQLAQLSYMEFVVKLAPIVQPNGGPAHDRYAYEVARIHLRYPGRGLQTLPVFRRLGESAEDPLLALLACFQGVSHAIRLGKDLGLATAFAQRAQQLMAASGFPDGWHGRLARSRMHRALALFRMTERDPAGMRRELATALDLDAGLTTDPADETDRMVALENRRILVEAQIRAAARDEGYRARVDLPALCEQLLAIDPYCVDARLTVGDGYAAAGDYPAAAYWYSRAGELGSGTGATGWFRAAQCLEFVGDRWGAANAMGHCLELDTTAVEPRRYLAALELPVPTAA